MISKNTIFKIESLEIMDYAMCKVAGVGIPADETYDPDFLYMVVHAVSAGEYYGDNKNGDYFPEKELITCHPSFLTGGHVFNNHDNKDPAKAIGDILDSDWDDKMKCVKLVIKIDRKIAPTIVRGIEKGYMTDVSMGCRVPYSICSICGNKARNPKEYCDHLKFMRRKILPDGKKVFEINIQPKFHDISVVLTGAEKVAKVTNILDENSKDDKKIVTPIEKVASDMSTPYMEKAASVQSMINDAFELPHYDKLNKLAVEKTAAIEKRVKGLILEEAKENLLENTDLSRQILKAMLTPYWSDETIKRVNLQLKALAIKKSRPLPVVFHEFLKVLDFAGIELSPREFTKLSAGIFGISDSVEPCTDKILGRVKEYENCSSCEGLSLGRALSLSKENFEAPVNKIRIVIRKASPIATDEGLHNDIMRSIVSPFIRMRSVHPDPLIKRVRVIGISPAYSNFGSISPISRLLYSLYQNDRGERLASGYTGAGMKKFASYFGGNTIEDAINELGAEKTAGYNKIRAAVWGTPVIYGYSKLQQSRMKNKAEQGEDNVSSLNRMFAEHPDAIAGLNVLFGPKVYKEIKGAGKLIKNSKLADVVKSGAAKLSKKASLYDPVCRLYSEANYEEGDNLLSKFGFNRADFAACTAEKIAVCERELTEGIDKIASENNCNTNDFESIMLVNNLISKKIENLY